jgi:hypothetical protein
MRCCSSKRFLLRALFALLIPIAVRAQIGGITQPNVGGSIILSCTGTTSLSCTASPAISSLSTSNGYIFGMMVLASGTTGAATVAISGIAGTKPLYMQNLASSAIVTTDAGTFPFQYDGTHFQLLETITTTLVYPPSNSSSFMANTAFVQQAIDQSMATIPFAMGSTAGGNYSFATKGSGAVIGYTANAQGVISSIGTIYNGASGYAVGDLITSSDGNTDAVLAVTSIGGGSGTAITGLAIFYGGSGYPPGAAINEATAASYAIPFTFTLTGTLTSNATLILPTGQYPYLLWSNQWIVNNNMSSGAGGPFTLKFCLTNGSDACTGTGVLISAGTNNTNGTWIETDGKNDIWLVPPGPMPGTSGQIVPAGGNGSWGTPFSLGTGVQTFEETPSGANFFSALVPTSGTCGSGTFLRGDGACITVSAVSTNGVNLQPLTSNGSGGFGTPVPGLPIPQTGWTLENCSVLCVYNDFSPYEQELYMTANGTANYRGVIRSLPGSTYTIVETLTCPAYGLTATLTTACGMFISDGTKWEGFYILQENSGSVYPGSLTIETGTTWASGGTYASVTGPTSDLTGNLITLEIVNDGTHRTFYYWSNTGSGGTYTQFYQEATGTFLTETYFGIGGLAFVTPSGLYNAIAVRLRYMTSTSP